MNKYQRYKRDTQIRDEYTNTDPRPSMQELADKHGISRQRVYMIIHHKPKEPRQQEERECQQCRRKTYSLYRHQPTDKAVSICNICYQRERRKTDPRAREVHRKNARLYKERHPQEVKERAARRYQQNTLAFSLYYYLQKEINNPKPL